MNSFDALSGPLGVVVAVVGLVLALCALLMPLYVISMHTMAKRMLKEMQALNAALAKGNPEVKRMLELMEVAVPRVMKAQEDLTRLRRMWMAGKEE